MSYTRALLLVGSALALASCGADDVASPGGGVIVVPAPTPAPGPSPSPGPSPTPTPTPTPTGGAAEDCPVGTALTNQILDYGTQTEEDDALICQLSGTISEDLTLEALPGVVYSLNGRVEVGTDAGGATEPRANSQQANLTIEAGVVMFGSSGADFLLINRGSQLNVQGTEDRPVIMTSRTNMTGEVDENSIGQWGGLVILGRAPISDCAGDAEQGGTATCEAFVEGVSQASYGGEVADDNSGTIQYLQVRYPGFEVTEGNELNGITMGGVGTGTTFDHIQVHNSSDDGIEHFGGTVNARYVALTGNDDDSFDTDLGYKGFYQFVVITQRELGADRLWEADSEGNENAIPRQDVRLVNATMLGQSGSNQILFRGGGDYAIYNSVLASPENEQCLDIDGAQTVAAANPDADEVGPPRFGSFVVDCANPFVADEDGIDNAQYFVGENVDTDFSNTLGGDSGLVNGANETAVVVTDVTSLSDFLMATDYIGAVAEGETPWFNGWTCDIGGADTCIARPQTRVAQ